MGKCCKEEAEGKQCHRNCDKQCPSFTDQLYCSAKDLFAKLQQTPAMIQEYSMPTLRKTELEAMKKTKSLMIKLEKKAKDTASTLEEKISELERQIVEQEEECKEKPPEDKCKK